MRKVFIPGLVILISISSSYSQDSWFEAGSPEKVAERLWEDITSIDSSDYVRKYSVSEQDINRAIEKIKKIKYLHESQKQDLYDELTGFASKITEKSKKAAAKAWYTIHSSPIDLQNSVIFNFEYELRKRGHHPLSEMEMKITVMNSDSVFYTITFDDCISLYKSKVLFEKVFYRKSSPPNVYFKNQEPALEEPAEIIEPAPAVIEENAVEETEK